MLGIARAFATRCMMSSALLISIGWDDLAGRSQKSSIDRVYIRHILDSVSIASVVSAVVRDNVECNYTDL